MTSRDDGEVLISIALSADLLMDLEDVRRTSGQGDRSVFLRQVLRRGLNAISRRQNPGPSHVSDRDLLTLPLFSAASETANAGNAESEVSDLLTTVGAAGFLGVSPRTLEGWRVRGGGPRFVSISRGMVRYRRADLEAWINGRVVANTTEADSRLR